MKRQQAATVTDMGAGPSEALVRLRAVLGTLLALLALNGVLPLLGHSPVGPWGSAPAAAAVERVLPASPAPKASPGK